MSNEDVISSLPDDIVDKILVCLLLSEAISTSFLSRRWRYKWRSISEININEYDDFFLSTDITAKLDQLLLLHTGDIQKFSCQFRYEFVPSSIFSFKNLITIDLDSAETTLPWSFDGFKILTTLRLCYIKFDNDTKVIQRLIDFCPLLKYLKVVVPIDQPTVLELHAPNLLSLEVNGPFTRLGFENTHSITNASVYRSVEPVDAPVDLINLLSAFINVTNLKLLGGILFDGIPYESSLLQEIKFNFLTKFEIRVNLHCQQCAILCCILENAPSLVYLDVSPPPHYETNEFPYVSKFDNTSFKFRHLRVFDMYMAFGSKSELRFVKFVLRNAPLLETTKIEWSMFSYNQSITKKVNILIDLLSFKRASSSAKIIVYN